MFISDKIIHFNRSLDFNVTLPPGFAVLNPYLSNPETLIVMERFYRKFYEDQRSRKFLIGINPSRHGAGVTGVPFTDTKNLEKYCGITMDSARTHEISSVFMYDMIRAFGGPDVFYKSVYVNSPFPLAIVRQTSSGAWLNANYYDNKDLFHALKDYMLKTLRWHFSLGLRTDRVYVLGKKNAGFIKMLNTGEKLFDDMRVLDHPRFIQQYKSKEKIIYIDRYLEVLSD